MFYDYWFTEKKLPTFNTPNALISVLDYFMNRINAQTTNISTIYIIRKTSLYSNFAKEIMEQIINRIMKPYDINRLFAYLCDEVFFSCFLKEFKRNIDIDYDIKFLALSNVRNIINLNLNIL